MKYLFRVLVTAGVLALSACGGGGSDGGAATPAPTANLQVIVTPATASMTPFSLVDMPIRVLQPNGQPVRDGTLVTVQVTPPSVAQISSLSAISTGTGDPIRYGERVIATTASGVVNYRIHSRAVGSAIVTVSAAEQNGGTLTGNNQTTVNIVAGPPRDPRLTVTSARTTLPANRFFVEPFLGSPYLADVSITWRRLNGELVTVFPQGRENVVDVTVAPVLNTGGFSTPDDPETEDINEFLLHLVTAPVETNGGRAAIFLQSIDQPGTTTVYVSARDPDTDETVQAELPFTITNGTPRLPASISLNRDGTQVYITGSGGTTSDRFEAIITDGGGGLVPDPVSGTTAFNNVQAEIVGGAQNGEKLAATTAAGATVRDGVVKFRTFNGVSAFSYQAGTRPGLVTIRATVDRADNNVDNGIQDGVQVTRSLTVGDGRLFDLDITGANIRSIRVNPFSVDAELLLPQEDVFNPLIPPRPDGTYSYSMSAIATDRFGAPVVPGTEIRFGLIDSPQTNFDFAIKGTDGDPAEGTTGFSAPTGAFQTMGGGVGPGDTIAVFGEESNGNRDLESVRAIASVASQTQLYTSYRFNFNDDTGVTVNNGPVLSYVMGRAGHGTFSSVVPLEGAPQASFGAAAFTDFNGIARVTLNYGVSKLGRLAAVYAQGVGDLVNNSPELVTDVEIIRFPGIAPGQLIITPSEIPGNKTVTMNVCIYDRLRTGVQGQYFGFYFRNMGAGVGRVNGVVGPGTLTTPTNESGCVQVQVSTTGMAPPGGTTTEDPEIVFETTALNAAPQTPPPSNEVLSDFSTIVPGLLFLSATPEVITGDGGRVIDLVLTDATGSPVSGSLIVGSCVATGAVLTITTQPGVTNAQGRTQAVVSGQGFDVTTGTGSATGTCTFTVAGGAASDTVRWLTQNICDLFSPAVPNGCPGATLTVNVTAGNGTVGSIPTGISCFGPGSCQRLFAPNSSVQLVLSTTPTAFVCQTNTNPPINYGTATTASVLMPAATGVVNCTVTFP